MTTLLYAAEIERYCRWPADKRAAWFRRSQGDIPEHPDYLLPGFEICLALTQMAHKRQAVHGNDFVHCLNTLAQQQELIGWNGHVIQFEEFALSDDFIADLLSAPIPERSPQHRRRRGDNTNHDDIISRFRSLSDSASRRVIDQEFLSLEPLLLPTYEQITTYHRPNSLVMDNNSLIPLLDQLSPNAAWPQPLQHREGLSARAAQRCTQILDSYANVRDTDGDKIVIPVSVLEECHRVIERRYDEVGRYGQARGVLRALLESDAPLWASFEIESLSIDIVACYLYTYDRVQLDFADALAFAHAIKNGCPFVSADEKCQHAMVEFPFLSLV